MDWVEVLIGLVLMPTGVKIGERTRSERVAALAILVFLAGLVLFLHGLGLLSRFNFLETL